MGALEDMTTAPFGISERLQLISPASVIIRVDVLMTCSLSLPRSVGVTQVCDPFQCIGLEESGVVPLNTAVISPREAVI